MDLSWPRPSRRTKEALPQVAPVRCDRISEKPAEPERAGDDAPRDATPAVPNRFPSFEELGEFDQWHLRLLFSRLTKREFGADSDLTQLPTEACHTHPDAALQPTAAECAWQ